MGKSHIPSPSLSNFFFLLFHIYSLSCFHQILPATLIKYCEKGGSDCTSVLHCFTLCFPLPGGSLPLLPGRQHLHLPGPGVRPQCRRPAGQSASACPVPGTLGTGATLTKSAQLAFLRSRSHRCLQKGRPRASGQLAQRYRGKQCDVGI